jgi:hypothetical protein
MPIEVGCFSVTKSTIFLKIFDAGSLMAWAFLAGAILFAWLQQTAGR